MSFGNEMEVKQKELRGNGKLRSINIEAENLAEATHKTIIACYDAGARVETPKQRPDMTLGYDSPIEITILNPNSEPKIYNPANLDFPKGNLEYCYAVTHGIHNHRKKCEEHPEWWGYTYNERFVDQMPFVFQRIKADWDEKGRMTGRDYFFTIWRAGDDIVLEQPDPPCWQSGQIRFLHNEEGNIVMNYLTHWRSRDLFKAWNQNILAQIELMKLIRDKTSNLIGEQIELGSYIDHSSSLHLYGLYVDRDGLDNTIKLMKKIPYEQMSWSFEDSLEQMSEMGSKDATLRLIAAQLDAEHKGHGLQQSRETLKNLEYDVENFDYPKEWDTWPESWDAEPDVSKLARVVK